MCTITYCEIQKTVRNAMYVANPIKALWEILKEFCGQAKLFCLYTRDHSSRRKLCVTYYLADDLSRDDDGNDNV